MCITLENTLNEDIQYQIFQLCTYLFKSQGTLEQARADLSLEASEASEAFWNIVQANSHSSTPP